MNLENGQATKDKHRQIWRMARVALFFLPLLSLLGLVACYPMPERIGPQPGYLDTAGSPRAPFTQVYFYPKTGQTIEQQSRDHYECYNWAGKQTGFDPSLSTLPPEQRVRVVPLPPPGHDTAAFAVAGAVLGALLGGPRHAAQGALIGATGGTIAGAASDSARLDSVQRQAEAYGARDRARSAQIAEKELDFRRAMSACLEGRGYSVR